MDGDARRGFWPFAEAWYDEAGDHICTRTGTVVRNVEDEVRFDAADDDTANTCDPEGSYHPGMYR